MKKLWTVLAVLLLSALLVLAQISVQVEPKTPPADTGKAAPPRCEMLGKIAVKSFPAITVASVMEKAVDFAPEGGYPAGEAGISQAYEKMMTDAFNKLGAWMSAGGMAMGAPFAFFFEDPEKTAAADLTCKVAFPTMSDAKAAAPVMIESLPEYTAVTCTYKGPYEASGDIWKACSKWVTDNGYVSTDAPMEVYLKSQADKVPPAEYMTEIRIPVKKAAKMPETKPAEGGK
jgi:effector-binding domain-containing protein